MLFDRIGGLWRVALKDFSFRLPISRHCPIHRVPFCCAFSFKSSNCAVVSPRKKRHTISFRLKKNQIKKKSTIRGVKKKSPKKFFDESHICSVEQTIAVCFIQALGRFRKIFLVQNPHKLCIRKRAIFRFNGQIHCLSLKVPISRSITYSF